MVVAKAELKYVKLICVCHLNLECWGIAFQTFLQLNFQFMVQRPANNRRVAAGVPHGEGGSARQVLAPHGGRD